MALAFGTMLGPYEIAAQIGKGGMGEVYRALDTHLGRTVAIKILPDAFAHDPERLARFEREAKTLAALNHPNIAGIYGLEKASGTQALVMELVEGSTLADRIAQGPIPFDEALPIAHQIAEALEAAHEQGIIHRDLKPANIKVRPDGTVKVLDFGLAKAMEPSLALPDLSQSPTVASPVLMTSVGVLLGTAAYMSPEQARGRAVDKRTDIWAFGCVIYEMLTGRQAFEGEDVSLVLAKVIERQPDFDALPDSTPLALRKVLTRCFEKNVKRRLRDIGDALVDLDELPKLTADAPQPSRQVSPRLTWRRVLPWALVGAVIGSFVTGALLRVGIKPAAPPVQYFAVGSQRGERPWISEAGSVTISPGGRHVAYLSVIGSARHLRVWAVDSGTSTTLVADGLPAGPFFSPDGQWVGFFDEADSTLKKVRLQGGIAHSICRLTLALRGASWAGDGSIVFGTSFAGAGLFRVPANGGTPKNLTAVAGTQNHRWPSILPQGRAVLFTNFDAGRSQLSMVNLETGAQTLIVPTGGHARYAPTGHIVFASGGGLAAVRFDLDRLQVLGEPVAMLDRVVSSNVGVAEFEFSTAGSLVYVPGGEARRVMGWVDQNGDLTPVLEGNIRTPRLSPDGTKVAFTIGGRSTTGTDIWVRDLQRGSEDRLTFEAQNMWPMWTPTGTMVTFGSNKANPSSFDLYVTRTDVVGEAQRLADTGVGVPGSWTADGRELLYTDFTVQEETVNGDIWIVETKGGEPRRFLATRFSETAPRLSSDGRWMAFVSDQSGEPRIYVEAFPQGGQVIPVSTGRGTEPVWSRDGSTLFYRDANKLMAASITARPSLTIGQPHVVFAGAYEPDVNTLGIPNYDVSPDGKRFLMVAAIDEGRPPAMFVQNWFEEVKRFVPIK
jgi:Tol biopolymer transport system component